MSINKAKHKNILIKILKDIYSDPSIGPLLGFKGGTAAFLFYDLNRFSVDLDFDLLEPKKTEFVFKKIQELLINYGTIKEAQNKKHTILFLLSYKERDIKDQNVKIEINLRNFSSNYEIKKYLGIAMKVMIKKDMLAHKLCAMSERIGKTNRDIFDVYYFLNNNWPVNKKIVEDRTKMKYKDFLEKCIKSLEKVSEKTILYGMGELLDEKQKNWVKTKLKSETIFLLKLAKDNEK